MQKIDFFGTFISEINEYNQLKMIKGIVDSDIPGFVTYTNVHVVVTAIVDKDLQNAINSANIVSPDGTPLVWIAKKRGFKNICKCSGPDMMKKLLEASCEFGYSNYFYGSTEKTLNQLEQQLRLDYLNIKISGMYSPPYRELTEEEIQNDINRINCSKSDIIWVGLGAPKQEIWMSKAVKRLDRGVLLGVGAAFDFFAKSKKRAPLWMQKKGLEWLFRLFSEPRRLWKRYLTTNTLFIYYLIKYKLFNKNIKNNINNV